MGAVQIPFIIIIIVVIVFIIIIIVVVFTDAKTDKINFATNPAYFYFGSDKYFRPQNSVLLHITTFSV